MENLENENLREEPQYIPPQAAEAPQTAEQPPMSEAPMSEVPQAAQPVQNADESIYRGAGVGRKESPFANSPYVMNHAPQPSYHAAPTPPKPKKAKKKSNSKTLRTALAAVLALVVIAGSCGITAATVNTRWESRTAAMEAEFNVRMNELEQQIANAAKDAQTNPIISQVTPTGALTPGSVYAQNVRSVVLITCEVVSTMYGQSAVGTSAGSGFILTENGYVVTNAHVVDGATKISVQTHDGQVFSATLVGSDTTNDVAVLKVDAEGLDPVVIGSSESLAVGDQVVAIGNPLGELTSTMTAGYVSAKNRDVTTDGVTINMIQTDAAINSGNSGGPLFNMAGEVVGITTAKYSGSSSSGATIEGIGFAIPIDDVIGMIDDLVNYGYVKGAYLGVMVSDMDAATASYYGMPVGAYVQEVTAGYCAEEAGLKAKDIIVAVGEHKVTSLSTLTRALRNFKAGDTTTITVYRGGREIVLDITLDEKPRNLNEDTAVPTPDASGMPEDGSYEEWYNYFAPFFGNKENQD